MTLLQRAQKNRAPDQYFGQAPDPSSTGVRCQLTACLSVSPSPAAPALTRPGTARRTPSAVSCGRSSSPASEVLTSIPPVSAGIAHCSAFNCFCALATSGGVCGSGSVPPATGTSPAAMTRWPSTREYAVAARAPPVSAVLRAVLPVTPL